MVSIACNYPYQRPYIGISQILTQTARARENNTGISPQEGNGSSTVSPGLYAVQSGDTLAALTSRFQISQESILNQNSVLLSQGEMTTLMPGMKLILVSPEGNNWETQTRILPNTYFIYGPTQMDFDIDDSIDHSQGWLKSYIDRSGGNAVTGVQIVSGTAENYSISPKVLLALLEYHLHALSDPTLPTSFSLGNTDDARKTLGKQLSWAANVLNNGYYGWREGVQTQFTDTSGKIYSPNPADSAASFAFMYYFSQFLAGADLQQAISSGGFTSTYQSLFGGINWESDNQYPLIPANLHQPVMELPLQSSIKWAFTGGPHSGWGIGYPYAAIDFAPPAEKAGCDTSPYWVTAAADGIVSRLEGGSLVLDLDGDGKLKTGWSILYLHLDPGNSVSVGSHVRKGDQLGHPSCLGGNSSGRNIHIARLYNGEWIPAGGVIPLNLGGWIVTYGEKEYKGSLTKDGKQLNSSSSGEWFSQLPINN